MNDLILIEVLRGFAHEHDFNQARTLMTPFLTTDLAGYEIALAAARNFRQLRARRYHA
ncbi:MAG: hypothetical protein LBJ59_08820 [Zoogloeaceae bacterium]|nr:hypothetical protein [Zoogloeaceae bacterium]